MEKVIRFCVWILIVAAGGFLTANIFLILRREPTKYAEQLCGEIYEYVGREGVACFFPQYFYDEEDTKGVLENGWNKIWEWSPLITYLQQEEKVEIIIEDETTNHELIEETQIELASKLVTENQKDAVLRENETTIKEEPSPAAEEEESLPAWTNAVEVTPNKEIQVEALANPQVLLNQYFVVDPTTTIGTDYLEIHKLLDTDLKVEEQDENPDILIYHTHSQEGYADSVPGDASTTVVGVGDYLTFLLEDVYGYQVVHLTDSFDLKDGNLERSKAYNYALPTVEQVLTENPSIQVVIDLHRDGVPEGKHLVTEVNGKPTAQIMLFNGLSKTIESGDLTSLPNPYLQENLAFSFQLSYEAAKYYPNFTRCIYLKGYRYNLHVRPRSILLEVGAQTNTVEEAKNAMEPFSVILNKVLKGE